MDRITSSLMSDFAKDYDIEAEDESVKFEHFCNYIFLSKEYRHTFSLDDTNQPKR